MMKVDCKKEKIKIFMWYFNESFPLVTINLHLYNHVFDYSCHEKKTHLSQKKIDTFRH